MERGREIEMYKEMVSIITPTYNAEKFLEETIQSVLNQSFKNFEMIIVDDCSKDRSVEIAEKYASLDERVKVYKLEKNSGAAVVRNTGIERAKGRYIAFLDSDDLWDKDKLEKQIAFMKTKDIGFSFTAYRLMDEEGGNLNKVVSAPAEITYKDLLKNTVIGCLTVVIDREKIGDFRMPLVRAGQDTATWLSILKKGNVAYGLNEDLASYRKVKGSISSNKIKALKRTWNTYRNIEKLRLIPCVYYYANYVIRAIIKRI